MLSAIVCSFIVMLTSEDASIVQCAAKQITA